jgi:hypothetical protein
VHVRRSLLLALGLAALAPSLSSTAQADETFFCNDGTSVTVTSANREAMQEHPCVKQWFSNDAEARAAKAAAAEEEGSGRRGFAGAVANKMALAPAAAAASQGKSSPSRNIRFRIDTGNDKTADSSQKRTAPKIRFRRR